MTGQPRSRVAAAYDHAAAGYDARHAHPLARAENAWLRRRLIEGDHLRGQVLDVGCGTGFLLDLVPELTPECYIGFDIAPCMVQRALAKHPGYYFRVGDIARLCSGEDGSLRRVKFDRVASLFCPVSYVPPDVRDTLAWMAHVLRSGGRALVMGYGARAIANRVGVVRAPDGAEVWRRAETATAWAWWATRAGLELVSLRGLSVATRPLPAGTPRVLADALTDLDAATLGRLWPDRGNYVVAELRKP